MRGEERQCRIVWVRCCCLNICGHGIPRLEGTDDMCVCASCGGNCRTGFSPDAPDTEADGSAVGCRESARCFLLAAWVSREEIGYGDGAMLMASGIFSGILAECGVVFNGAYADCSGGVVWTHCEA